MKLKYSPKLEPDFLPSITWQQNYLTKIANSADREPIAITMRRSPDSISRWNSFISPSHPDTDFFLERSLKTLLWLKGGYEIKISNEYYAKKIAASYALGGAREFDFISKSRTSGRTLEITFAPLKTMEVAHETTLPLGRHLDGCRIGFDLGGSDRKCAAVIDGKVVFSEEIPWDPYFQTDPQYHIDGIRDSLKRAAAHLPRVDAIGGSAAGVYCNNEVMAASLFRGINDTDFNNKIGHIFHDLQQEWQVPFEVINDGEVTALAGSMSLNSNGVLGISMGTSVAAGYVTLSGDITPWLNELAFVPIDYRPNAPTDEWSGDNGCSVQYFSQQGVARLAKKVGLKYGDMPFPEQLVEVQKMMAAGDERAADIFSTIGTCFGYAIAGWSEFYDISKLLVLGRVTSGCGGDLIISQAEKVLAGEFEELAEKIEMSMPNEQDKRHGQAIAAASLPELKNKKR